MSQSDSAILEVFITHILTNPQLIQNHKRVEALLNDESLKPYRPIKVMDVASDVDARNRWRQKCGADRELPCVLCNGIKSGSIADMLDAQKAGRLTSFLRLDDLPPRPSFDDDLDDISITSSQADRLLSEIDTESFQPSTDLRLTIDTEAPISIEGEEDVAPTPSADMLSTPKASRIARIENDTEDNHPPPKPSSEESSTPAESPSTPGTPQKTSTKSLPASLLTPPASPHRGTPQDSPQTPRFAEAGAPHSTGPETPKAQAPDSPSTPRTEVTPQTPPAESTPAAEQEGEGKVKGVEMREFLDGNLATPIRSTFEQAAALSDLSGHIRYENAVRSEEEARSVVRRSMLLTEPTVKEQSKAEPELVPERQKQKTGGGGLFGCCGSKALDAMDY